MWRLSGGQLGFGDVRLAGLLGAATGAVAPSLAVWTFLLGSVVGAGVGDRCAAARHQGVSVRPSMLLGVPLAVVLTHLLPR